jgi:hypothetical protein
MEATAKRPSAEDSWCDSALPHRAFLTARIGVADLTVPDAPRGLFPALDARSRARSTTHRNAVNRILSHEALVDIFGREHQYF